MWKKIGIKNQSQGADSGTPRSNGGSSHSRSFRRLVPMDEKSLVEKDSNNSRVSNSSSRHPEKRQEPILYINGQKSPMYHSQTLKESAPLLHAPSLFRAARQRQDSKHLASCQVLPRYSGSNRSSHKEARLSELTDDPHQLRSSETSMIEELNIPVVQSQRLVQDYVQRLQRELKSARRVNQYYEQKLSEYRGFVIAVRKEAGREIEAMKAMMKATTDQISRQIRATKVQPPARKKEHAHTQSDQIYCDQRQPTFVTFQDKSPSPINREQYLKRESKTPEQAPDQDYCDQIQNVMSKIDELKEEVHSAKAFKKDILNRIDANLRRVGGIKKTKGFDRS